MKLTTKTKPLIDALKVASAAIARKSTLPQLSCALVEGRDGKLFATCDNLDSRLTVEAGAIEMEEPFGFLVSPRLLTAALRAEDAEIEIQEGRLIIQSAGRTTLHTLPVGEFTPSPELPELKPCEGAAFISAIKSVIGSVSDDPSRHMLQGAFWCAGHQELVATNGTSLLLSPCEIPIEEDVIIPTDALRIIISMDTEDMRIGLLGTRLCVASGGSTFTTKTIEARFPNYRQVIPEAKGLEFTVSRDELNGALSFVGGFAESETDRVDADLKDGKLHLKARSREGNEAQLEIEAKGKANPLSFSFSKVLKLTQGWVSDEVHFQQQDEISPMIIKPGVKSEKLAVLMPLRRL